MQLHTYDPRAHETEHWDFPCCDKSPEHWVHATDRKLTEQETLAKRLTESGNITPVISGNDSLARTLLRLRDLGLITITKE